MTVDIVRLEEFIEKVNLTEGSVAELVFQQLLLLDNDTFKLAINSVVEGQITITDLYNLTEINSVTVRNLINNPNVSVEAAFEKKLAYIKSLGYSDYLVANLNTFSDIAKMHYRPASSFAYRVNIRNTLAANSSSKYFDSYKALEADYNTKVMQKTSVVALLLKMSEAFRAFDNRRTLPFIEKMYSTVINQLAHPMFILDVTYSNWNLNNDQYVGWVMRELYKPENFKGDYIQSSLEKTIRLSYEENEQSKTGMIEILNQKHWSTVAEGDIRGFSEVCIIRTLLQKFYIDNFGKRDFVEYDGDVEVMRDVVTLLDVMKEYLQHLSDVTRSFVMGEI